MRRKLPESADTIYPYIVRVSRVPLKGRDHGWTGAPGCSLSS
jgi:hypothetical protein